jgi:F-type H+-transporting ATPase subunit b
VRARLLLAGVLFAAVAFVGGGATASAQENGTDNSADLTETNEECLHTLEEGGDVDDCQEAPSPILPPTNELIWGSISFVLLFALLTKFAYPGIKKGMEGRSDRIRTDLESAESAKADAQRVLDEYRAQLGDAKAEAGRIIEEARQQADALKKDQAQRLQSELTAMRERASADIESAKVQAVADLRAEIASLAIGAAEVIVQHNLDPATQTQLVEQYISSVASRSN